MTSSELVAINVLSCVAKVRDGEYKEMVLDMEFHSGHSVEIVVRRKSEKPASTRKAAPKRTRKERET